MNAMHDLFPGDRALADGAIVLTAFALPVETQLLTALDGVVAGAPFRHLITPGGFRMSVAMTNCGTAGWVSDRTGYRYDAIDPDSGRRWPAMPPVFADLATRSAERVGFGGFAADACLINRYAPGSRLSLHQDRNERDYEAPIVSVSLGLLAVFLFGGAQRTDRPMRVPLQHGDVVVWGGPARLAFHGVAQVPDGLHPLIGRQRINLTFRKAL
jgi:DNA oxidative demethylase